METPGLSPWLLFLLCPRSHPRGLIQALEFKYQPPAQGSYVYVFSSGLSAEPLTPPSSRPLRLPRTFSPRFQLIGSESELLVSLGSSFSVGDHVCFFFFFFSYPTFSQTEIHRWLFPQNLSRIPMLLIPPSGYCRSSFVWVTLRPSDSFSASVPPFPLFSM